MFILPLKLGFIKSMRLDMKAFAKTKSRQDSSMWYISTRSVEFWNSPFTHMYRHQVNSNNAFVEQGCSLGNKHNTDFYLVIESINWLAYSLFELFYLCGNTYMYVKTKMFAYLLVFFTLDTHWFDCFIGQTRKYFLKDGLEVSK